MTLTLVVLLCGLAAGVAAFLWSTWQDVGPDPIDPAAPERAALRMLQRRPAIQRFLRARLDRQSAGGFLLTASFAIVFVVAMILGFLLDSIRDRRWLATADASIATWGSEHGHTDTVVVLRWITELGSTYTVIGVLTVTAVLDYRRRRNAEVFGFMAAVGVGQFALSNLLKLIVGRARPDVVNLVAAHGFSFPSGHTTAASATWSAIALVIGRQQPRKVQGVLAGLAALVAASVAVSRALLGVHWVTDVLGGLALGWGWFMIVAVIYGLRTQRMGDVANPHGGAPDIGRSWASDGVDLDPSALQEPAHAPAQEPERDRQRHGADEVGGQQAVDRRR